MAVQPVAALAEAAAPAGADPGAMVPATAERRNVTVLFADLVGFTPFAEERDPEEVRDTLSRYFELARELIERHGGTVEKFIGDAVMAVWGTPAAHEDDPERAVRAGLELVDAVPALGPGMQARAGILTGEAAVTVGATEQGLVAGDLVNTASRLQSVAPAGTVIAGEATFHAASKAIAFEPVGDQLLKGKVTPVAAWRALRVVADLRGRNRSEALEAPFVGREAELRLLKDMLHTTTRERRARLVSVTGIAGIGKSRLAWEFEKYLDGVVETVRWHVGRSPAYGEGITFWALGEMVRSRAGLLETDDAEVTRAKVAATVDEWVPDEAERRWIESALLALLGSGDSPAGGREGLFAAWRTFFERIAAHDTVAMVFEDLHWADTGLLDFIDHLLEWSRDYPILIVTLARPELLERRPDWGAGKRNFTAIGLEALSEEQMRELLAGLVPGLPTAAVNTIVARADGVPLYAVETVRVLLAESRLVEDNGVYRPVGDLRELAVPETLSALIAARLDALETKDRALLQDAAVLGQSFTPAALASITGTTSEELEPRLRALVRREVLAHKVDARSPERGQFSFVQALIREVAYNRLAKPDRKARHLAAARWFESLGEDELAGALAAHYLAAYRNTSGGPEADALAVQARLALKGAGDRAVALGSLDQAITFYDQALTVTPDPAEQVDLLERAADAATFGGHHADAQAKAERALVLVRELGDRPGIARATAILGRALLNSFRTDEALEILEAADRELGDLSLDPAVIALTGQLARAYFFREEQGRAIEVADRVLAAAEHADLVEVIADTLVTKGAALCNVGRGYEGLGTLRAGKALADSRGMTSTAFRAIGNLVGSESYLDPRASYETAMEGLTLAQRLGRRRTPTLAINTAQSALRVGEWSVASSGLESYLAAGGLEPADWVHVASSVTFVRALRGEPYAELFAELERTVDEVGTSLAHTALAECQCFLLWVDERFSEAADHWLRFSAISALNAPFALPMAAHCYLTQRDASQAASVLAAFDETGSHGSALEVERRSIRAGLLALDGRVAEALGQYREVLRQWRDLGLPWDEVITSLDMLYTLGSDEPEARAAGERARDIMVGLGGVPLVNRLEKLLAARPAPAHAAASRSTHEANVTTAVSES